MRVAAHAPVARGQRREVEVGVRVGFDGSRGIVIGAEKLGAGEKRRTAALGADPEQRVRLAVEDGPQRRVGIREVQQRDVAQRLERQQARGTVGGLQLPRRQAGARRDGQELDQIAAGEAGAQ